MPSAWARIHSRMAEVHLEPYLVVAGLTHNAALIAWGGFYFRVRGRAGSEHWKLVDDSDLDHLHPPRYECIGVRSTPYGRAVVEVLDGSDRVVAIAETSTTNHTWVNDLEPDTSYTYRVTVNGEAWADGPRRDWVEDETRQGLYRDDDAPKRYSNRFRTFPFPDQVRPLTFAIIGDFGVGIRHDAGKPEHCQLAVAHALERALEAHDIRFVLTTGDNIYAKRILGLPLKAQGDEDDDWFFTYYQPYRYVINRMPFFPCVGNHDSAEMEETDDREQVIDNFYLRERFYGQEAAGRASIGPGLFYRFRFGALAEFVALDTSRTTILPGTPRLFQHENHQAFIDTSFPQLGGHEPKLWRVPFGHHPPYCAGPRHGNAPRMIEYLVPRFHRSGVRVYFGGHEHNYQHSLADGIHYFVTGAAGKIRTGRPDDVAAAHTVSWASAGHFLLVKLDEERMSITPIGIDGNTLDVTWIDATNAGFPVVVTRSNPTT
jgi:tartrate-resistant acid phosphatase type 5